MNRRAFLQNATLASLSLRGIAARAEGSQTRSLSFVHTHTGERVSETYFDNNGYVTESLGRINRLLRDFRTDDIHAIDVRVLDILHDLQTLTGHEAPYEIISGYRSPKTNAALRRSSAGVAEHSFHMQGRAIDVRLSGYATSRLHELALTLRRGGVGFYPRSDFVHLDSGPVRFW
ncbi:MAG: YcbK family protein [Proteobacteria bacterium]|nr:YcbK family protein [Pseudomonadota bacterium]